MVWGKMAVDWQQRVDFDRLRKDRIARANKMLHKYGIGAALIYNWDGRRYVSSYFKHTYRRHMPFDFFLLIRDNGFPYIWAQSGITWWVQRDKEEMPWLADRIIHDAPISQPYVIKMWDKADAEKAWAKTAQYVKSMLKEHGVAGLPVSIDYSSPYLVHALEGEGMTVVDGNAWMMEARMVKTEDEVNLMSMAATCNEAGYGALVRELRPGMRENDAQAIMSKAIYEAGAEYIEGWVINSGARGSPRSPNWSDKVIRPGELLNMEACHVTYCGYKVCYDRTFLVGGKPTELQKALYEVPVEAHRRVQALLKPGIKSHEIDKLRPFPSSWRPFKDLEDIRKYRSAWSNHFGGIGMGWWEAPVFLPNEPEVTLEKNMIITYHMIFWAEGGQCATIENTYRITDTGCEALTKWPYEELMVIGT